MPPMASFTNDPEKTQAVPRSALALAVTWVVAGMGSKRCRQAGDQERQVLVKRCECT